MTVSANVYANALDQAFQGNISWSSHPIKIALLGSGYTPNLSTDTHWSDISANEVTGTGYTAGGATLGSPTHTVTAANNWGTHWTSSYVFNPGDIVRPSPTGNGYLYYTPNGGTSGSTQPTWPTVVGETVNDNGVIWTCLGESLIQWSSNAVSWPSSTITASYAAIYDASSGTSTTEPLICLISFGAPVSSSAANFAINPPSLGWFWLSPA